MKVDWTGEVEMDWVVNDDLTLNCGMYVISGSPNLYVLSVDMGVSTYAERENLSGVLGIGMGLSSKANIGKPHHTIDNAKEAAQEHYRDCIGFMYRLINSVNYEAKCKEYRESFNA